MDRRLPVLLIGLLLLLIVTLAYIIYAKPSLIAEIPLIRTFSVSLSPSPTPLSLFTPTPTRSPEYVIPVSRDKNAPVQINGVIEYVGVDNVAISSGGDRYAASADATSYVECRDKYITSDGKLVPAHTIFYDLSRYVTTLQEEDKAEEFVAKGSLFRYPSVSERIPLKANALVVIKEKPNATKGFSKHLLLLIVYGCK